MEPEHEAWQILLLGENHTDPKAARTADALRGLADAGELLLLDEGLNSLSAEHTALHLPLEDEDLCLLPSLTYSRSVVTRKLPSEPDAWLDDDAIQPVVVFRWRTVLQNWALAQHRFTGLGIVVGDDQLLEEMTELLALSRRFHVSRAIPIGGERGEAFFDMVYRLGRIREPLRAALDAMIQQWVDRLRQNPVAVLFLARVTLPQLLDDYDRREWLWLRQMRNFGMARQIFFARQQHPQLRVVVRVGSGHLEDGIVAVQDYLRDIYNTETRVLMIDDAFDPDTFLDGLRRGSRLKRAKYDRCAHCGNENALFHARHTGRRFCNQTCLDAAHGWTAWF